MSGPIHCFLAVEHRHLEQAFREATADLERIDMKKYARFRACLLRHIAAEEKILIPAAKAASATILPLARKIRTQHGAITALLAPPPSPTILRALRAILESHDALEEMRGGLYDRCENLVAGRSEEILDRLHAAPEVPVSPYAQDPEVIDSVRRILARAGYEWASFEVSSLAGADKLPDAAAARAPHPRTNVSRSGR
jgi:hypothetical protein